MSKQLKTLLALILVLVACAYIPIGNPRFDSAILQGFSLVKSYAQKHVLLCLVPAFFIAGALSVFVSHASVMKYLGPFASRKIAYSVAAVSGTILAVCSCTVLPLFAGIYRMGAGLGPACAFLYAGPAINALAIILTARVLGWEIGFARAIGAVAFSVLIGIIMSFIFKNEEQERASVALPSDEDVQPLWKTILFFFSLVMILICANIANPENSTGFWAFLYNAKWYLTAFSGALLGVALILNKMLRWQYVCIIIFSTLCLHFIFKVEQIVSFVIAMIMLAGFIHNENERSKKWTSSTLDYAAQIIPLLLGGVFIAGLLLGGDNAEGLIPSKWVQVAVGGNGVLAILFASCAGSLMYFATLTEIPIVEALISNGMGEGPALALLLAGPALSLPNMIVIHSVLGSKKTFVYILLVVVMATVCGMLFSWV